ncbi:hypothetical protein [Amycolatopsis anabasis]|uniref:hypothetical protein n=1 Tax=Amycolatopsis anabasis TaxID=1840409 RepID=UPI001C5517C9|nr:hypothetical protein [Amycolatopsis anabasis]
MTPQARDTAAPAGTAPPPFYVQGRTFGEPRWPHTRPEYFEQFARETLQQLVDPAKGGACDEARLLRRLSASGAPEPESGNYTTSEVALSKARRATAQKGSADVRWVLNRQTVLKALQYANLGAEDLHSIADPSAGTPCWSVVLPCVEHVFVVGAALARALTEEARDLVREDPNCALDALQHMAAHSHITSNRNSTLVSWPGYTLTPA